MLEVGEVVPATSTLFVSKTSHPSCKYMRKKQIVKFKNNKKKILYVGRQYKIIVYEPAQLYIQQ